MPHHYSAKKKSSMTPYRFLNLTFKARHYLAPRDLTSWKYPSNVLCFSQNVNHCSLNIAPNFPQLCHFHVAVTPEMLLTPILTNLYMLKLYQFFKTFLKYNLVMKSQIVPGWSSLSPWNFFFSPWNFHSKLLIALTVLYCYLQ